MVSVDRIKGLSSTLAIKTPVLAATTAPITLSGLQTIDGVSIPSGGRVLVKDQVDTTENGWYDASTSAWQRSLDANASNDLTRGTLCLAARGTLNGGYIFQLVTATAAALPGTTGMTFTRSFALGAVSDVIETLLAADDAAEALTTLGVSAFIQTLLGDTDAATARETLGLVIGAAVMAHVAPGTAGNVLTSEDGEWVSQPPAGGAVQGAFKNLKASATGLNANVLISCDEIIVESADNKHQTLRSVSLSINSASVGANGLDVGTLAISTWYAVWVIWNGTTTEGLLSLSDTAPTLPSGYTHKARVGWIRTDATVNKYPLGFTQRGRDVQYLVAAGSNVTAMPAIASGVQGSVITPTWIPCSTVAFCPPTASQICLSLNNANALGTQTVAPNNSYGAYNSTTNPPPVVSADQSSSLSHSMVLETTTIYYASNIAAGVARVSGWEDNL